MERAKAIAVGVSGFLAGLIGGFIVFVLLLWMPGTKMVNTLLIDQQRVDRDNIAAELHLLDTVLEQVRGSEGMSRLVEDLQNRRVIVRQRLNIADETLKVFGVQPPPSPTTDTSQ